VINSEATIRQRLRPLALEAASGPVSLIEEFWVPASRERVDLAVVGQQLWAFEVKSPRDSLKRLPRQIVAFSRLFDRCTAVLASKHLEAGVDLLPTWWGVIDAGADVGDPLVWRRPTSVNADVDVELLVQLLWRDEAAGLLRDLGIAAPPRLGRQGMWRVLLKESDPSQLCDRVRSAVLGRDPRRARIPTRRLIGAAAAAP
jgi:hypothetical protein